VQAPAVGERRTLDWALANVHDAEAFLATLPKARKRRLTVLRQFFTFARTRRIVLADPTRGLAATAPQGLHRIDRLTGPAARTVPPLDHQPGRSPA